MLLNVSIWVLACALTFLLSELWEGDNNFLAMILAIVIGGIIIIFLSYGGVI